jgi:carbamoylphosphate synthase large subunit
MPRKNPETKFKEKVIEDLKTLDPIWFSKIQQVAIRGIPDILLCLVGNFVALELKVDSNLTELQKYNLKKITLAGGYAYEVTPKNWKKIFQELKEIRNV